MVPLFCAQASRPKQQCPCCLCPVALYVLLTQPTPTTCMALTRFATGRQPHLQLVLYTDSAHLSASEHYFSILRSCPSLCLNRCAPKSWHIHDEAQHCCFPDVTDFDELVNLGRSL